LYESMLTPKQGNPLVIRVADLDAACAGDDRYGVERNAAPVIGRRRSRCRCSETCAVRRRGSVCTATATPGMKIAMPTARRGATAACEGRTTCATEGGRGGVRRLRASAGPHRTAQLVAIVPPRRPAQWLRA
jgi:hypothetical protein